MTAEPPHSSGLPAPRPDPLPAERERADPAVRRVETIARWLDDRLLDPILGFFAPVVGDLIPAAFGLYVVVTAVRKRLPAVVIARMLLNIGIDALLGIVPVVGDVFDIVFKANRRNADLLVARHEQGASSAGDWVLVGAAALLCVAAVAAPIVLLWWGASTVWGWLS
ncbi:DUF4112 domain-containing protein [Haliangium sp.]|uniref:DUF4112 domain-containing protein n=1 Tax=Haliangium sp. TaxID=2663208 RepID=UPI003D122D90